MFSNCVLPKPNIWYLQRDITSNLLEGDIRIFDYSGRMVYSGKAEFLNNSLTFSGSSGLYLVEINKDGIRAAKKLVKL